MTPWFRCPVRASLCGVAPLPVALSRRLVRRCSVHILFLITSHARAVTIVTLAVSSAHILLVIKSCGSCLQQVLLWYLSNFLFSPFLLHPIIETPCLFPPHSFMAQWPREYSFCLLGSIPCHYSFIELLTSLQPWSL